MCDYKEKNTERQEPSEMESCEAKENTVPENDTEAVKKRGAADVVIYGFLVLVVIIFLASVSTQSASSKPVIYLYPEKTTDVSVRLDYNGTLEYTYPHYQNGWEVTARPDGTLIDRADGREYSYLFWDGKTDVAFDFTKGFVVKGTDTIAFLQEKLAHMGLTPREYNEFIVYWLPLMEKNPYNLISFQEEVYTDNAVLTIEPRPDSMLRVYMAFRPLNAPVDIPPQELKRFERKGFAVVEWGGSLVK